MPEIKLFPHQDLVLNDTYSNNRVAYYLDMGLGKTFVGSEKLWELNTPYNLVVCQKSKIDDWKEHFENFYPDYHVIIYENQAWDRIPEESILIINYDKAWRRPFLSALSNFTLMLDESQHIKNPSSKRSKFILNLKPKNVILLSGTPTGGKYEELISQVNLLGWNISKDTFMKLYVEREWDERNSGYKVIGYKNVERLKRKLSKHGAVFMKTEEVFDLPKMNHINVRIRNTKHYREFHTHHIIELPDEVIIGDTPASALIHLRQFAGWRNQYKLEKVQDLIESTNDRLIIFYNFKNEFQALREICKKLERPISTVNGDGRDFGAYEESNNSISLIQYQAGATGLNLQKANKIIYFTLPQSSELFEQSKKRIHRIGQDKPCFYYYLLVDGSIEHRIYQQLKLKKNYSDELFEKEEMK
ncbi:SNF2-related protein [Marinilactibacillus psychrotolerans]|uniref:SNF2 family DNA/RNA helicase n=1 Tax=Marinilactibacillus psychrotolerans TaxID=191770 RepID=A0AAV3WTS7_9LACT|nr:DEAD/DEAH box helicase [Marinilactibacillus psychrotolerans]GEL67219.1 helicase SNF2 [Marinilactibacillus psychrotolerans]GEQ36023.1 SNF2 family DNA/RNA helicase [Marinilactibacillus psychrotolerans]SDC60183.1 Helicase conserved C-terminal domain-containing protein [Marinilactibacillus psychrotolerans]